MILKHITKETWLLINEMLIEQPIDKGGLDMEARFEVI